LQGSVASDAFLTWETLTLLFLAGLSAGFHRRHRVHYPIAFAMIAGQLIGGRLGASMAIRHGESFIRVIFIAVLFAMLIKLLWDQFGAA
jgi:uncharacterized membrane protein YfcA